MLVACALIAAMALFTLCSCATTPEEQPQDKIVNNCINQSVAYWPYMEHYTFEEFLGIAAARNIKSIELLGLFWQGEELREKWDKLKEKGMVDACHYPYPFAEAFNTGLNETRNRAKNLAALREGIGLCNEYGFPNVIAFVGLRDNVSEEEGLKNCVDALTLKTVVIGPGGGKINIDPKGSGTMSISEYAEKKGVNIVIELLNSKTSVEMKGHPRYQGDNLEFCKELIRRVDSPRVGLLMDFYHLQMMEGNLITNYRICSEYVFHCHTAGVPGRCEIDENQEINYRPIVEELARSGYMGYVGHEFIPQKHPPLDGLIDAITRCDVPCEEAAVESLN